MSHADREVPLMDEDAQRLYVNAMLSHPDIFVRVSNLLQPSFFDPQVAKGVKFLKQYFEENRNVPATSIFTAATKLPTDQLSLTFQDREYLTDQIAKFCKFRAVIELVQKSVGQGGYLETGDLGTMVAQLKAASEMGVVADIGIDYFKDVEARLASYDDEDEVISTGWSSVDALIGGGVGRQELIVFVAPSGGGKSVGMLNLARNFMLQGLSGVYISLEMKDKKVSLRTDQMLARMSSSMVTISKTAVAHEIHKFHEKTGVRFFIKRMRETTTTASDITAYLRELEVKQAFKPDWVVVDYLDIMAPVQKGAGDSMFLKDKFVSEEVRALGFDLNAIMISGSQLGKHATDAINEGKVIHQGDIQGGSSKTNTSDLMISMEKTEAMHSAGEYRFGFPKARNSDATGKTLTMKWDKQSLRISDLEMTKEAPKPLDFKKKQSAISLPVARPTGDRVDIEQVMAGLAGRPLKVTPPSE
jgi:replicative DNA helicase